MSTEEKKRKKMGIIIATLFVVLIGVILPFITISSDVKPDEPVELIVFDFTGSTSNGGSSDVATPTETVAEDPQPNPTPDPVVTQNTESATTTSASESSSTSSEATNNITPKPNSDAMFPGMGGSGSGTGTGSGSGTGETNGIGDGVDGPGVSGLTGKLGNRKLLSRPKVKNPVKEEGMVAVEITVLRSGNVSSVTILRKHSKTTTNNTLHYAEAKRKALEYKFAPNPKGKKYEKGIIAINFTLQ